MDGYPGNFIEHGGQVVSFAAAAAVWLGLTVLGAVLVRALARVTGPVAAGDRIPEANVLFGWAAVSLVFTVTGVFTPVPFTVLAAIFAAAAVAGAVWQLRRGDALLPPGSLRMALLALPLLVLVSAMVGSQWDEFSDWLASPRQILVIDTFPDDSNKHWGGSLAAYPYGWHFITYLASRVAGRLVENAGALINVFLLLTFGLVVLRLIREGLDDGTEGAPPGWGLYALAGLSVTLLNPTFAQKVALTSYADVATAVSVAIGGVIGWRMLGALARGDGAGARALAAQVGLVMLVLVNLKQATVVLFALVVGAVVLAGLRDPDVRRRDLLGTVPWMIVPGIVIYVVWRFHVTTTLTHAEMVIHPFDAWLFEQMGLILWNMLVVLSKKGAYLALMVAAVVFAVRGLLRFRTPFDRLAIITGAMFLGYNGFLFFAYVTTFGALEGPRVASLWRYNMHLGPMGIAFAAHGLAVLWRRKELGRRFRPQRFAWVPVALMIAAPFVFAHKLRFDRFPNVPHFRIVGHDVAAFLKPGDRLFIIDPKGSGESGVITRFELGISRIFRGYLSRFHPATEASLRQHLARGHSHLLVHSTAPALLGVLGVPLEDGTSYLLESDGEGGWRIVQRWPYRERD